MPLMPIHRNEEYYIKWKEKYSAYQKSWRENNKEWMLQYRKDNPIISKVNEFSKIKKMEELGSHRVMQILDDVPSEIL